MLGIHFFCRFFPLLYASILVSAQANLGTGLVGLVGLSFTLLFASSKRAQAWSVVLVASLFLAQLESHCYWWWIDLGLFFMAQERLSIDFEDVGFPRCPFSSGLLGVMFFLPFCWFFSAPMLALYLSYRLIWNLFHWPKALNFAALFSGALLPGQVDHGLFHGHKPSEEQWRSLVAVE